MTPTSSTMARARQAVRTACRHFFYAPNVQLIDFGFPEKNGHIQDDKLAIRFHVKQKLDGVLLESAIDQGTTCRLPVSIDGFPVDIPEGKYETHRWSWPLPQPPVSKRKLRQDRLHGGISISEERRVTAGTLGGLVLDQETGAAMILSNWHVLIGDWMRWENRRIYQPGRLDGGTAADTIGVTTRHAMDYGLDAAVALLDNSRPINGVQHGIGAVGGTVGGAASAYIGMEVTKSGRTTDITRGRVTAIDGVAKITYSGLERIIRNVVTIEPHLPFGQEVSAGGDSGSWWLSSSDLNAVSLHFAGSNLPERALSIDMNSVLDALGVAIPAAGGGATSAMGVANWPQRRALRLGAMYS